MKPRDLSSHSPYIAGQGIEEVARERGLDPESLVKLASNENPLGPSSTVVETIRKWAPSIHVYPKSSHTDLVNRLAEWWNVEPVQIWLANGGDGALDYISRAMLEPNDRVLVPKPGFAYYGMSAQYHHGTVGTYPLERSNNFVQRAETVLSCYDGDRIVYLTSPHNPTGSTITIQEVEHIGDRTSSETLVLVDEAYGEFSNEESVISLVEDRDDVAILRTFSKAFGLAGLRLGYAIVPIEWADAYARVNTPFAASDIACRAGIAALSDEDHLTDSIETAKRAREYLMEKLVCQTWESGGNFVLADVGDAAAVADALENEGIIVRDCTSFDLPSCIRISCGRKHEMERVVRSCNAILTDNNEVKSG